MEIQKEEYEEMIAKLTEENEKLRDKLSANEGAKPREQSQKTTARRTSVIMDLERDLKIKMAAHQRRLSQTQENMFKFEDLADTFKTGMFLEAVRNGEVGSLERMLHFVDIDGTNKRGEAALVIAVKKKEIEM